MAAQQRDAAENLRQPYAHTTRQTVPDESERLSRIISTAKPEQ
jgi:hypothetical protein